MRTPRTMFARSRRSVSNVSPRGVGRQLASGRDCAGEATRCRTVCVRSLRHTRQLGFTRSPDHQNGLRPPRARQGRHQGDALQPSHVRDRDRGGQAVHVPGAPVAEGQRVNAGARSAVHQQTCAGLHRVDWGQAGQGRAGQGSAQRRVAQHHPDLARARAHGARCAPPPRRRCRPQSHPLTTVAAAS